MHSIRWARLGPIKNGYDGPRAQALSKPLNSPGQPENDLPAQPSPRPAVATPLMAMAGAALQRRIG